MENQILSSFDTVLRAIKTEQAGSVFYKVNATDEIGHELEFLSAQYCVTERQIVLLTILLDICGFATVDLSRIHDAMQCSFFSFLSLKSDLDALRNKELIEGSLRISIPSDLIDSIIKGKPYVIYNLTELSTKRILDRMRSVFTAVIEKEKSPVSLLRNIDLMVLSNPSTSIAMVCDIYGILSYGSIPREYPCTMDGVSFEEDSYTDSMPRAERMLFYSLLSRFAFLGEDITSWYDLSPFFSPIEVKVLRDDSKENMLNLQRAGVIESVGSGSDDSFKICDRVKNQLLSDVGGMPCKYKFPDVITYDSLKYRPLFFKNNLKERIAELAQMLSSERFMQVRDSLVRNGLRTSFTVLFYGTPGTGKTESVYQIARQTHRDIIAVNVSDLKTPYVGETEKNIKGLFDRYHQYVSETGLFPILLFNEADAVLGERSEHVRSSAERMENSVQNIILQEMERLDGIMIATTNLTSNLDKAFDRRFLYKICFSSPSIENIIDMFCSMIPTLTKAEAGQLAGEFQLSGGQIENVSRRCAVFSAIRDRKMTFEEIRRFCMEESSGMSDLKHIGF